MKQIPKPERLTETIIIRISETEKEILENWAKKNKVTMSLVIRHLIQTAHEE